MTKADFYRKTLIESIIKDGVQKNNRVNVNLNKGKGYYTEIITLDEIREVTDNFKTHKTVESFLNELVNDRLSSIMETFNYRVNESVLDLNTTNCYDGYELKIPLINENYNHVHELFNEIDQDLGVEPQANPKVVNKASNTPLTKEPGKEKTPHIPIQAKQEKTQNPRKVDLILKSVFDSKFNDYSIKTDTGEWKVVKILKNEAGKLLITWERGKAYYIDN